MARAAALVLLFLCLFGAASAESYATFADALNQDRFSQLKAVINNIGIMSTFQNPQLAVTVFAPDNNAFAKAAASSPVSIDQLMGSKGLLQQIVYYGIVQGAVSAPLPAQQFDTLLSGKQLTGAGMQVQGIGSSATITEPNVKCGAGLAHIVDNVLLFVDLGFGRRR
ncbi:hypothetical protein Rsub_02266 [Raphidocelis subcapitata]|uniref:FAS1 domain-containing protein n=1 Tax=Raphidocelis subcapitata TaxID=307507 RepID=A0A2V0NPJ8_9CHLO|nr:hypothetical protein Rsub_02266 [Raphidocelis subcapitata]|eukprot:GBF89548.1 hypothetical protein Rsub_02266 [Raphidocelis subcapitata]